MPFFYYLNIHSFLRFFFPHILLCTRCSSNAKEIFHKIDMFCLHGVYQSSEGCRSANSISIIFQATSKLRFIFQLSQLLYKLITLQKSLKPNGFPSETPEMQHNRASTEERYISASLCLRLFVRFSQNNSKAINDSTSHLTLLLLTFLRAQ